jgi:MoaA/NifB/PqqE/SkfB family radical SAM enzyme
MLRIYKEDVEFNQYSLFDTNSGALTAITEDYYNRLASVKSDVQQFKSDKVIYRTRFPRRIYFQITHKCNLSCSYCFIKANSTESHLPYRVISRIAKFTGDRGLMEVRLSGGEPTLHPDFLRIYEVFRKNNVYVSVATNCLWTDKIKDFLFSRDDLWVIASLDANEESHNKNRNGSFEIVLKNLFELRKKNPSARIRLNTVLTKDTYKNLEYVSEIASKLKAENISLLPLRPEVRNKEMLSQMLNAAEFKEVIVKMIEFKKIYGINFTTALPTEYYNDISKDKLFTKKTSCAAGREGTNLDFDNKSKELLLYGCSTCPASDINAPENIKIPFIAGRFEWNNVKMIQTIWEDDSKWLIFRDNSIKSYKCLSCEELGKRCTGSCPIQNINWKNLALSQDVTTQVIDQIKKATEWYCYKYLTE